MPIRTPVATTRCDQNITARIGRHFPDIDTATTLLREQIPMPAYAPQKTVVTNATPSALIFTAVQESGVAFAMVIPGESTKVIPVPLVSINAGNGILTCECYWLTDSLNINS